MEKKEIEALCMSKQEELLEKYFGNAVYEAVVLMPETIGSYTTDLPRQIEAEYFDYLKALWAEIAPNDSRSLDDLLDKRHLSMLMTEDDRELVKHAYDDAMRITLWERLTKTNHEDVTQYKRLLKVYAKELLVCMRIDFLEDVI